MKILSITDFKQFCETKNIDKFVYASENQSCNDRICLIKTVSIYKIMLISLSPNRICFKDDTKNFMCFNRVKYIKIHDEKQTIGVVFSIVCGDLSSDTHDVSYTMVAD